MGIENVEGFFARSHEFLVGANYLSFGRFIWKIHIIRILLRNLIDLISDYIMAVF